MKIRFGTDGWRGVISREFTFSNLRRVVAAVGDHLLAEGGADRGVAVGFDRRFLSDRYAAEATGVLAARGIPVVLAPGAVPTPLVSWGVRHMGLAAGVVITASHNPPEWNGVKFKEAFGGSARAGVSARIEARLAEIPDGDEVACLDPDDARSRGLVADLDVWDAYREAVWGFIDRSAIAAAGLTVAVDAMHGSGSPWLHQLLGEAGCRVVALRSEVNPGFGGVAPEPVEAHLDALRKAVLDEGAALGIANDGDADRLGAVDERGLDFSTQRVFALLTRYLYEEKGLRGRVVRSVSGTAMVDCLARNRGLELLETPIGFKHIGEAMLGAECLIGGEESGGFGVPGFSPERDGLLNALLLVEMVAKGERGLRALLDRVFEETGRFTYRRVDQPLPEAGAGGVGARIAALPLPEILAGRPVTRAVRLDGLRLERADGSWLLVRPSGTEPKLRLYAEARSVTDVEALLAEGRTMVGPRER